MTKKQQKIIDSFYNNNLDAFDMLNRTKNLDNYIDKVFDEMYSRLPSKYANNEGIVTYLYEAVYGGVH